MIVPDLVKAIEEGKRKHTMNKRIKQLIEQATTIEVISGRGYDTTQYIDRFDKEKFAELIIKECAELFPERHYYYSGLAVKRNIKEHFGVEE